MVLNYVLKLGLIALPFCLINVSCLNNKKNIKQTHDGGGLDIIQQWQIHEPVPSGQLNDLAYEKCKELGITSLQSYVGWAQIEPEEGRLDFGIYDTVVSQIRKHNLKWVPFLILGPYISTPEWFRNEKGVNAICLEHKIPTSIQSIWNPELKDGVKRFLSIFKDHFDDSVLESISLGISGNWGESIYPVGGGFNMGGIHTHAGWWCGDQYATLDFQKWLREKYKKVDKINEDWHTSFQDFRKIIPFIPDEKNPNRMNLDLIDWYLESMTDYAEFWVKTLRELYPQTRINLVTGGDGRPILGADFSAQAKMCAKYNAGIRITNMSDDMQEGFSITRMVSSSTRLYGGYYSTEPGGDNSPKGIAGRIFDIVSGGGNGMYFKSLYQKFNKIETIPDSMSDNGKVFLKFKKYLFKNSPSLMVGALYPNSSFGLKPRLIEQFYHKSSLLRDYFDYEFFDENMIGDDLLQNLKALIWLEGESLEQLTIDKIVEWVGKGGILIMPKTSFPFRNIDTKVIDINNLKSLDKPLFVRQEDENSYDIDNLNILECEKGFIVLCDEDSSEDYVRIVSQVIHSKNDFWNNILHQYDGIKDDVISTLAHNKIFRLNNGDTIVSILNYEGNIKSIEPRSLYVEELK